MPDRAILLGNGFSIAHNGLFDYGELLTFADLTNRQNEVFERLSTKNFEEVMRDLHAAELLTAPYDDTDDLRRDLRTDAEAIRVGLINALHRLHPNSLSHNEGATCASFLNDFDRIFTLNYDLLLYWVDYPYLKELREEAGRETDDGFRLRDGELIWCGPSNEQSIFYLHGAVHLIDHGVKVEKLRNTGLNILDQLADRLNASELPMFVSEGTADDKVSIITHNDYLSFCYDHLRRNRLPLTVYGFSFSGCDSHIVQAVADSDTRELEVFLQYDAPQAHQDFVRAQAEALRSLTESRHHGRSVELRVRLSNEVTVWR